MTQQISSAEWQAKEVAVVEEGRRCGPCKMMAPVIDEVAGEKAGSVDVYKIDVDQNPDIAQRYGVMSIPTLIVFKGGEVAKQALGAQPKESILSLLA